jgi:hypothetical protein
MEEKERLGWDRTFLLALGAFMGVITTAYLIHSLRTMEEGRSSIKLEKAIGE